MFCEFSEARWASNTKKKESVVVKHFVLLQMGQIWLNCRVEAATLERGNHDERIREKPFYRAISKSFRDTEYSHLHLPMSVFSHFHVSV